MPKSPRSSPAPLRSSLPLQISTKSDCNQIHQNIIMLNNPIKQDENLLETKFNQDQDDSDELLVPIKEINVTRGSFNRDDDDVEVIEVVPPMALRDHPVYDIDD